MSAKCIPALSSTASLRVLVVEDNPRDAKLMAATLEKAGYHLELEVADTPESLREQIEKSGPQVILCDYNLPGWTALDALAIIRTLKKEIPLLVVSGSLGDEAAVECVKRGATDYVLKDSLARLPLAVERALKEKDLRDGRKRAEEVLQRQALAFANLHDAVIVADLQGSITDWNPGAERVFGYSREEILGRSEEMLRTPAEAVRHSIEVREALENTGRWSGEINFVHKDGSRGLCETVVVPLRNARGYRIGSVGVSRDITQRKAAEQALRESEEKVRLLLDSTGEGIYGIDLGGKCIFCNKAFLRMLGYRSSEDVLGRDMHALIHHSRPDGTPYPVQSCRIYHACWRGAGVHVDDEVLWRPDGTYFPVEYWSYPVDRDGQLIGAVVTFVDISERKRAELALAAESARCRILFEESPDGIVIHDPVSGRLVEFNTAAHEQLGYTREEFAALNLRDIVLYMSGEEILGISETVARQGRADFESFHRTKQGEIRIVRVTTQPLESPGQSLHRDVWRDVTERRHSEQELRKLSHVVEQSPVSIVITTPAGQIEYVNPKFTQLTGYSSDEVRGKNPRILKSGETPAEEYKRLWETVTRGGTWQGELHNKKKSGELFWEHATISPIVDQAGRISHFLAVKEDITDRKQAEELLRRHASLIDQTYDAILAWDWNGPITFWNRGAEQLYGFSPEQALGMTPRTLLNTVTRGGSGDFLPALERGSRWEGELEQVTRDGRHIHLESRMVLVREAGRASVLEVNRDITERQLLEEQLRQAQKMEAIGRLAGGVAHDFNNLLGVILGYSGLMHDSIEDPALRKKLDEIHKAGQRAADLTRQLLAFSRKQVLEPRVVSPNSLIADMEKMLRRLIGEDVQLEIVLDSGLGCVHVDPGQMEQVIMNLAVNARDAMPKGGKITIETRNVELDELYARFHVSVRPGPYVQIVVSDTGTGMDQATQAHIFEPFFTTKKEGTGLGLATVYGIVKQSGGSVWVYSEPGEGTTFKIYLPRLEQHAGKVQNGVITGQFPGGTETILIVEDAEPVRTVTQEFLELGGYTVLSASSGAEALEIAARSDTPIHLLLTDVIMPEMSGPQLAEKLKALRCGTKVLFMSGYTDAALAQHSVLETGKMLIMKPFSREALTQKVREALNAA